MAYLDCPITIKYKDSDRSTIIHKKTFQNTNIDWIYDRLMKNRLPGFTESTVIVHIGIGNKFV
jgi:hypothetical protein